MQMVFAWPTTTGPMRLCNNQACKKKEKVWFVFGHRSEEEYITA